MRTCVHACVCVRVNKFVAAIKSQDFMTVHVCTGVGGGGGGTHSTTMTYYVWLHNYAFCVFVAGSAHTHIRTCTVHIYVRKLRITTALLFLLF